MALTPGLWLYLAASSRGERYLRHRFTRLARLRNEPTERVSDRMAEDMPPRPDGQVVWFHAARGSRIPAFLQLIDRLVGQSDTISVLLTTEALDQVTGALPEDVVHALRPADSTPVIERFLAHWSPDIAVFSGSALWPATILACRGRGVPLLMIDAHFTDRARRGWAWAPFAARQLLDQFEQILTGSQVDAENLRRMGAADWKVEIPGFLEEGTSALGCNEAERDALAQLLAARPVWLAAQIDLDEAKLVEAAHRFASRHSHRLLLIVVPTRPEDGPAIAEVFANAGWNTGLRTVGDEPDEDIQVYVADTDGEMGLWYRLAPISFIGETLEGHGGGHDPYEAAALGSAVIHGPSTRRHEAVFDRMGRVGAARKVTNATELGEAVAELLAPDKSAAMAHRAWEISSEGAEVADRALVLISKLMDGDPRP